MGLSGLVNLYQVQLAMAAFQDIHPEDVLSEAQTGQPVRVGAGWLGVLVRGWSQMSIVFDLLSIVLTNNWLDPGINE